MGGVVAVVVLVLGVLRARSTSNNGGLGAVLGRFASRNLSIKARLAGERTTGREMMMSQKPEFGRSNCRH